MLREQKSPKTTRLGRPITRAAVLALLVFSAVAAASQQDTEFFETKIRPLLAKNCFACHTATKMGGLEMTSRQSLLDGGGRGPAVVPGQPEQSLLLEAVRGAREGLKMPPQGGLTSEEIRDLETWIANDAVWPEAAGPSEPTSGVTPEQRSFWSYQPVKKPALPSVKDESWVKTPVDRFILAKQEERGLQRARPADKRALLRRAYFDLIGLPPTPEQIDAFLSDGSPEAFVHVVDGLLASPRYGERWGRYWLDIARYSDDKLNSTQMEPYPQAHRYRDWVIRAFNNDMPYDRFLKAQLAGDLLEQGKDDGELVAGLGFYALSPQFQDDRIDATGQAFLGLTLGCARCHDHKFDPIPTEDYYALLGVFNSTEVEEYPLAPAPVVEEYKSKKEKVDEEQKAFDEFLETQRKQLAGALAGQTSSYLQAAWQVLGPGKADAVSVAGERTLDQETLERWVRYLGGSPREHPLLDEWDRLLRESAAAGQIQRFADEFQTLVVSVLREKKEVDRENEIRLGLDVDRKKQSQAELRSLERDRYYVWRDIASGDKFELPVEFESGLLYYKGDKVDRFLGGAWKQYLDAERARIKTLDDQVPEKYPFLHVIADVEKPANEHVHIRGNEDNPGEEVPRRFLSVLCDGAPKPFEQGSGRLELAQAIADANNPLTARVMVNRLWLYHFGEGIVRTASNFGQMGERPTHPELLDYLAARFVESNWSVKTIHREIMLSATYALSSETIEKNHQVDSENRLFWRANRRRLDAETLRDSLLYVAGNLEPTAGGPPVELTDEKNRRRTVYGYVSRRKLDTMLGLFDFPNPNSSSAQRIGTNTPLQGLFFLNSGLVMRQAKEFTSRLDQEVGLKHDKAKIGRAYSLLYGRSPSKDEVDLASDYLRQDAGGWPRLAQVLMCSNEFLYVP